MHSAPRAVYSVEVRADVVILIDLDGERSVTNDAEAVVAQLVAGGVDLARKPLLYRDTMLTWDEIRVEEGRFAGFRLLNALTLEHALALVARRETVKGFSRNGRASRSTAAPPQ